jgi:hypothetical protein
MKKLADLCSKFVDLGRVAALTGSTRPTVDNCLKILYEFVKQNLP